MLFLILENIDNKILKYATIFWYGNCMDNEPQAQMKEGSHVFDL